MTPDQVTIGARVILIAHAECYPHYMIEPEDGWTGTIAEVDEDNVWIQLDRRCEGLDEWFNRVQVSRELDILHQEPNCDPLRPPPEVWARCDPRNEVCREWDLVSNRTTEKPLNHETLKAYLTAFSNDTSADHPVEVARSLAVALGIAELDFPLSLLAAHHLNEVLDWLA